MKNAVKHTEQLYGQKGTFSLHTSVREDHCERKLSGMEDALGEWTSM